MYTIVIAEDESRILQGLSIMVEKCNLPIQTIIKCKNGHEAWSAISIQQVDILLTDVQMPEMDGFELIQKCKEIESPPVTAILSNYDTFEYAKKGLNLGIIDYLVKPIKHEDLKELLIKIIAIIIKRNEDENFHRQFALQQLRVAMQGRFVLDYTVISKAMEIGQKIFKNGYIICCSPKKIELRKLSLGYDVGPYKDSYIYIIGAENIHEFKTLVEEYAALGYSDIYKDIVKVKSAYQEAVCARKQAFLYGKSVEYSTGMDDVDGNREDQIVGFGHLLSEIKSENDTYLEKLFCNITNVDRFVQNINIALSTYEKTYSAFLMDDFQVHLNELRNVLKFNTLPDYQEVFYNTTQRLLYCAEDTVRSSPASRKIKQALVYIAEHYNENIDMQVVAKEVSMNYSNFSTNFKKITGKKFVDYLHSIRVEAAKQMLIHGNMTIKEITLEVGMYDPDRFSSIFKEEVGETPIEYRRSHGNCGKTF